jgi:flagellar hook-basal body complex protein FliE
MSTIPTVTVTPADAARAYSRAGQGAPETDGTSGFGAALQRAVDGAIDAGHAADAATTQAISGQGNLTDVVTAVSRAELALQSTVAIRDRVVQAYQDIMRMPI